MKVMNYKKSSRKILLAISCMLMTASPVMSNTVFDGDTLPASPASAEKDRQYYSVAQVVPDQAQLVYYYPAGVEAGPLNVYVDKEFHTALLPGEFTTLCVAAGPHTLVGAIDDAPLYKQKDNPIVQAVFNQGQTYFVRGKIVAATIKTEAVKRSEAENELLNMRKHMRLVNRASGVQNCRYTGSNDGVTLLQEVVLFKFGGSNYSHLLPESKRKLDYVIDVAKRAGKLNSINIIGFTDGIGRADKNRTLSEARAQTIRKALMDAGISGAIINAQGDGVAQSAGGCGTAAIRQDDGCNKLSRRVDIMINGQ